MIKRFEYRPPAWLTVTGEDASDYLQSQFTNNLDVPDGSAVYGLWLDVKGKVRADSFALRVDSERYHLWSDCVDAKTLVGQLEQHIIADDVACERTEVEAIALYGAPIDELTALLGLMPLEPGRFRIEDGMVQFAGRRDHAGSLELICLELGAKERVGERFASASGRWTDVSKNQLQRDRIAAGIPAIPRDVGPTDLPAEAGLERVAISFTKGCFLGQEVVARMHHLGRPRRALCRAQGTGALPAEPVELVTADGKAVGRLTTVVATEDGWAGLGLVKRAALDADSSLLAAGRAVSVSPVS